ncbi:hypothetical protein [Solobacterium sp.]|uniref:hypothetical protein n=1 Tax=Solobacterium sp. TaxID=2060878 RepID=UPI001CABDDD7|nr:hypothetical protein [Solobacterium sp.]MBF1089917.1 hypothetical protein [Solobacterium sp.]
MSKYKMVLIGSTILLLILSPRFVVKAEEINSNTIVDMDNRGKSDFLMGDGFPNIYTKNIMTVPNSNGPLESEKSKSSESEESANQSSESEKTKSPESEESANQSSESEKSKSPTSEPNANQSSESEKTKSPESEPNVNQSTESGSNTNQSVDFDKDNDNLNVSNEEIEMSSDNIEGNIIQSIDANQFVESDNNKIVEENNEISDENGFNLISSAAENKFSKQKRYDVLKVIPTKNINNDWQLSALNIVILTSIILTGIYGISILLPMVQTLIWINRKQTMLLSKMGNYKNYE